MFFSVIVPVYKVENYIKGCIESVISQSFSDFELILVDDGSPDSCPQICDEYAEKDDRIKVLHKENGGLVSARQAGILKARGEYIFNLDGDDFITSDALQTAYDIIASSGADIVFFSYMRRRNGCCDEILSDYAAEGLYGKHDISKKLLPRLPVDKNMKHLLFFLSGKAIRREIAYSAQLGVDTKISLGEDICCLIPCLMKAQKAYMSRKAVYIYNIRNDSLTTDFKAEQISQIADATAFLLTLPCSGAVDLSEGISRYSAYMTLAILAAAAEGKRSGELGRLKKLISDSVLKDENAKAQFDKITLKSAVSIKLIKHNRIKIAFVFLYICKCIKDIFGKRGEAK